MSTRTEMDAIFEKYRNDEYTVDDVNKELEALGVDLRLVEGRNQITPEELAQTSVGDTPEEANGWGMMNTAGIGGLEKMKVTNGKFDYEVTKVDENGKVNTFYTFAILDKKYQVVGDHLEDLK